MKSIFALALLFCSSSAFADMTFDHWEYQAKSEATVPTISLQGTITESPPIKITYGSVGELECYDNGTCKTPKWLYDMRPKKPVDYNMRCWGVGGAYTRCENDEVICYAYNGLQCHFK